MPTIAVGQKVTAAMLSALPQSVLVDASVPIASGANDAVSAFIPFGVTFTVPPRVNPWITVNRKYGVIPYTVSTTGCTVRVFTTSGSTTSSADTIGVSLEAFGAF